jgi:hypothetical protein
MTARLEWKPQDLWIGVFWKKDVTPMRSDEFVEWHTLDVWICCVPCLPIHLRWLRLKGGVTY